MTMESQWKQSADGKHYARYVDVENYVDPSPASQLKPATPMTRLDHATAAAIHYLEAPLPVTEDQPRHKPTVADIEDAAERLSGIGRGPALFWGVDELELLARLLAHYGLPDAARAEETA
jgi:hypothetical protein